jgi:hypothetical protein
MAIGLNPMLGVAAALAGLVWATPASAAVARTWLAQSGSDSGNCTYAAPCATIAYAVGQTVAGGEVIILDGGNYAGGTIGKSLALRGAGTRPTVNAITISAAAGDKVFFDNLVFSAKIGDGSTAYASGLSLWSGSEAIVNNCLFESYTTAIDAQGPGTFRLTLTGTVIYASTIGIRSLATNAGQLRIKMFESRLIGNTTAGVYLDNPNADVMIAGSTILGSANAIRLLNGATGRSYGNNVVTNGDALIAQPMN